MLIRRVHSQKRSRRDQEASPFTVSTVGCLEFPNTIWILHFWENSSTSNALSLKAHEPGRDRLMDACGPQSEGNFTGLFPEAEFQLKDLLWRKAKLPDFLSHRERRHRCEKDRFASINTSCCVKMSVSFLPLGGITSNVEELIL